MDKKILLFVISVITALTSLSRDFSYTYKGQTLVYSVLDENAKTVETKQGAYNSSTYTPGNNISGILNIPSVVKDGNNVAYSVTTIGGYGFAYCTGLTSVTIPNSVTSIGNSAFYNCTGLTKAEFASIESLCNISFGDRLANPLYYAHTLYINGEEVKEVVIPNSVTSIGSHAFGGCTGLTSVTIPNSVTSIGDWAFNGCSSLTQVTIPNSVTSINSYTFFSCSGLSSVIIPNSVTSIGSSAFNGCSGLTSVTIPNSVTSIGDNAFYGCSGLTSVIIGNSVTSLGSCAFYRCTGLTSVTIPNSVTSIGGSTFHGCTGLTSVTIGNSVTSIGDYAFWACSGLTSVKIPNSVTEIGQYAFAYCSKLTSVTIPNSLTEIGSGVFSHCSGLTSLTIPNSVTSIGDNAFNSCTGLISVTIGSGVKTINNYAFYSCNIKKAFWLGNTPPEGYRNVSSIINYVANEQYNLTNMYVYKFLSSKFSVGGTVYVPVSPSERICDVVDCEYSQEAKNIEITDKVINKGVEMNVKEVMPYSFYGNTFINSVKISNDGNIGKKCFEYCSNLKTVNVSNKGFIGLSAFSDNSNLQNLTIRNPVTELYGYAFYNCTSLKYVFIPNSVKSLGSSAFEGCRALENISIGKSVLSLPYKVFSGCSSLKSISIPANVTSIGNYVFEGCSTLEDVTFEVPESENSTESSNFTTIKLGSNGSNALFSDCPLDDVFVGRKLSYNTNSDYGYSPFYRNTTLRSVDITDAETQIYDNEFYGCSNLKSLKIGNGVTKIGKWAFSGCSSLDFFSVGDHVETIGDEAFSDCTGLTKFYSYSIVPPVCGSQALDDINKWECTLYVPQNSIDDYKKAVQWKEFFFIEDANSAGIEDITAEEPTNEKVEVYNLSGLKIAVSMANLSKGVYIVKRGGKVTKVFVE